MADNGAVFVGAGRRGVAVKLSTQETDAVWRGDNRGRMLRSIMLVGAAAMVAVGTFSIAVAYAVADADPARYRRMCAVGVGAIAWGAVALVSWAAGMPAA